MRPVGGSKELARGCYASVAWMALGNFLCLPGGCRQWGCRRQDALLRGSPPCSHATSYLASLSTSEKLWDVMVPTIQCSHVKELEDVQCLARCLINNALSLNLIRLVVFTTLQRYLSFNWEAMVTGCTHGQEDGGAICRDQVGKAICRDQVEQVCRERRRSAQKVDILESVFR